MDYKIKAYFLVVELIERLLHVSSFLEVDPADTMELFGGAWL